MLSADGVGFRSWGVAVMITPAQTKAKKEEGGNGPENPGGRSIGPIGRQIA